MAESETICTRCILPDKFPGITFDGDGVCSVCHEHEQRWQTWDDTLAGKRKVLDRLCEDAKKRGKQFDALVPLSGGKDSTYVLYLAVKELGLKCLAYSMDNGYLTQHAKDNISKACRILGVEHIYYDIDPTLVNRLFAFFMRKTGYFCSVCLRGISMTTERVADMYDAPLVLAGTSSRTELPLCKEMFQPGPVDYVKNVLKGEPLEAESDRLFYGSSLKRWFGYRLFWWGSQERLRLCAWINLPDYIPWDYDTVYRVIREELDWQAPEGDAEHTDCGIHPVTTYLHNRRFPGIEVRRLTLGGLVMAGQMSREEALRKLEEEPEDECPEEILTMFIENLDMTREEFDKLIDMGPRHMQFASGPSKGWLALRTVKRAIFSALGIRKRK